MPFQIGDEHGQEFVNDMDISAFQERELMGLGTGRSEIVTVQVD